MRTLIVVAAFLAFWPSTSFSQCIKGNCQSGVGVLIEGNSTYAGEFKNGVKNGRGIFRQENAGGATVFNCNYANGKCQGDGLLLFKKNSSQDDDIYIVKFENDTFKDGSIAILLKKGYSIYYRASHIDSDNVNLALDEALTKREYCNKNPNYYGCVLDFFERNKSTAIALLASGYLYLAIKSETSYTISDLTNGMNKISSMLERRSNERGVEFANRILKSMGIPN